MIQELNVANPGGGYATMDPASLIATYNKTSAGSAASSSGANPMSQIQQIVDAIGRGDWATAQEAIRQFNVNAAQRAHEFDVTSGQTATRDYGNLASNLLSTGAGLRGPADWTQFQRFASGGRDLNAILAGNQPRADFQAPVGQNQPASLETLMQQLGFAPPSPSPLTATAQAVGVPTAPTALPQGGVAPPVTAPATPVPVTAPTNAPPGETGVQKGGALPTTSPQATSTMPAQALNAPNQGAQVAHQVPHPFQINPAVWDSLGPTFQSMALSAAEGAGWDRNEYLRQINAARPMGAAPNATATQYNAPQGAF